MKHIIRLEFEKLTKNTHKYAEVPLDGKPPIIKHLYIQKWAAGQQPPPVLTITIEGTTTPPVTV